MGFWFPFTITVVGIQVYVERSSSLGAMVADGSVRLLKNGVFSGDDKASPVTWGKIDQVVSYGGPGDLWNETWTMADILSPNFGFGVSATSYAGAAGQTAYIDYMAMQVYYMGGPGCLLSVTLEAFDVQIDADGNVQANWLTATENDNDYFTLERSQDGVEFQGASVISGAGNSNSPINYSVVDHNPISGLAFYRLKSTDFDGENSYSDVLSIDAGNNMEVEMTSFPNPASSEINIDLENPGANGFVGLYDLSRRMVRKVNTAEEQSFVKLEVADLPRGMYILMYHTTKGIKSQRLVLQ